MLRRETMRFPLIFIKPPTFLLCSQGPKNLRTSAATEVETVSTFQPPLSTSCCICQSCLPARHKRYHSKPHNPTSHNGSCYVALPEAVPDVLRLPVEKFSNSAGADGCAYIHSYKMFWKNLFWCNFVMNFHLFWTQTHFPIEDPLLTLIINIYAHLEHAQSLAETFCRFQ